MTTDKLLPCAHCGDTRIPHEHNNGIGDCWLECFGCGCGTGLHEHIELATKAWNRRASAPSLEAAPQPVGAWRPIETAPRGEWLLAWRDHAFRPLIVKWDDQYGAFENEWGDHVYEVRHWQPLPAPPCALSSGGEG